MSYDCPLHGYATGTCPQCAEHANPNRWEAGRRALRVLAQRGVVRAWGEADVEHMLAALDAADARYPSAR